MYRIVCNVGNDILTGGTCRVLDKNGKEVFRGEYLSCIRWIGG